MKRNRIIPLLFAITIFTALTLSCDNEPFGLSRGIKDPSSSRGGDGSSSSSTGGGGGGGGGYTPAPGKPDLVAVNMTRGSGLSSWEVYEGETYKDAVTVSIKNNSSVDIKNLFKVGVFGHTEPDVYYDGRKYGSQDVVGLKAGETKIITMDLTIPYHSHIGKDNYIGLWVDYDRKISESNDNDNKGGYNSTFKNYELGPALKLLEIHENEPDIVPVSFSPPSTYTRGSTVNVPVSIKNKGHKDITTMFKVGVYMQNRSQPDGDMYVYWYRCGKVSVVGLAAGETQNFSIPITSDRPVSSGYIGVWVDYENDIDEMETEWQGDGDYNRGGYNGVLGTYETGPFLKAITIIE